MGNFESVYRGLNQAQKQAVDTIDGPLLVIAGPGTGKTQLLSARVAYILNKTDTLPQNILCLTFTESGAQNMRERLTSFIGSSAYDVAISTYHAFGGDLIRRFPEYFMETRLERPIDELGKRQVLSIIIDNLSYRSPLKQTRHHLGDLMSTISEVKRGLLTPQSLLAIAADNLHCIEAASRIITPTLDDYTSRLPSKLAVAEPLFRTIYDHLQTVADTSETPPTPFPNLAQLATDELATALASAHEVGKTMPLTKWKNAWLAKDVDNHFILAGRLEAQRTRELATVLRAYEQALEDRGLYDFDDMILRAIKALETHNDLKYSLQEQYQYILLDEFQDTNAAQLRLVELLTDNPAHEGRPNVLAVGDDDQAIYAFQGAQYSNMLDYFKLFTDVLVVNLSENYRSTPAILETAKNVSNQITDSLQASFSDLQKELVATNNSLPVGTIARIEYTSDIAEYSGIAEQITNLIAAGVKPSAIAILAPKHRYLMPLVPYLQHKDVPVHYERRENVLEAPVIRQLLTMSKLALALQTGNQALADSLWPEVLSYDFWKFPVSSIWQLAWQANSEHKSWIELLITHEQFRAAALLFLTIAGQLQTESFETVLDRLIGTEPIETGEADIPSVRSPLRAHYIDPKTSNSRLYEAITELTVLRTRLQQHQLQQGAMLNLSEALAFVAEYEAADEQLLNTSPYSEAAEAVQLMTVFKAKGLEFDHVFLIDCHNDVWGSASRGNSNKLTLPANLLPIRHAGTTDDERLRIFFVAITRAKYGLHLSSYQTNYSGKVSTRLRYLQETTDDSGNLVSQTLPLASQTIQIDDRQAPTLAALELNWQSRHTKLDVSLKELLRDRLSHYQLSPTHLTTFIDLEHAGPQSFLLQTLLNFRSAPTVDLSFGNTMHETLEWIQQQVNTTGKLPLRPRIIAYFASRLQLQMLTTEQQAVQQARGEHSLQLYLADKATHFTAGNRAEHNFRTEGVLLESGVHLGGKIDLLELDSTKRTIRIIDYKTGALGTSQAKLHRYELQLYCYKLLVEGSHSFKGYTVSDGVLVFVEPDDSNRIQRRVISFDSAQQDRTVQLLTAMWKHVQELKLPDISSYGTSLTAIKQFEQALIDGTI